MSKRSTDPGSTTARGYGTAHQTLRRQLLADLAACPGQPCTRCGHPMYPDQALHLDHEDDRSGYRGLAHAACNVRAGAIKGNRQRRGKPAPRRAWSPPQPSRW
ncbi:hypothetical protein [Actinomadura rupiterrae]|uniref:hypothetical protein n=1 Tax=Actinomadura rupiterrae TaxID=559627 RepID=UPI0020A4FA5A|nr:hypothetical protein [Actinomadura rupiterrae]MCP2339179.1 hypothetical protein [Actinomadura rupiterrae]